MQVVEAVAARRARGLPVFDLSVGQPATPAPEAVRRAAAAALADDRIAYTAALGLPRLRAAVAGHYARCYGRAVSSDEVVMSTGSSGAFLLAFLAAFDPGDEVVLARPGYPAYRNMLQALGCQVIEIDCAPRFALTVEHLAALPRVPAGVVLASPGNPTGTMVTPGELRAVAAWCDDNAVRLVSDEI
ncbi:MAG: aminotransferase class I/II-fold pyridoxal phosphate-dependent enzyme, partial [Actinobacteria bacterium]|nr:aminotransferase class I/II-fold pyridoxal phosphate-dependent enzyme [Actinomycetota bacterium]